MLATFLSRAVAATLLLAALSVAASAQVMQATGKITLRQADGTEAPAQDAVIKFYRTDIKQEFQTKSNKKGEYVHAGIPLVGIYTIAVSAPGARPSFIQNVKISQQSNNDFALDPGDGSSLTLEQIRQAAAAGGGRPAEASAAPAKMSEEDKKRAAEAAAERARIEAENAKIAELNVKLPEILKSGNDAFTAKKYDEAISFYDQGIQLDPKQAVFYRNKGVVLRARGVEKFNAATKEKDVAAKTAGKEAAKEDFKNSAENMEKALATQREHAAKNAATAPAPGAQPSELLSYLFDRAESYRIALQTGAVVDTGAAVKAFEEYIAAETDSAKKMKGQASLGEALFLGGRVDDAISTYRQVISTSPENLDAMYGLGLALAAKVTDAEKDAAIITEARDLLQRFISKAPDTHPKKAEAVASAQYLDETLKSASAPKPSEKGKGSTRRRP